MILWLFDINYTIASKIEDPYIILKKVTKRATGAELLITLSELQELLQTLLKGLG
jgi:hypothetical protein